MGSCGQCTAAAAAAPVRTPSAATAAPRLCRTAADTALPTRKSHAHPRPISAAISGSTSVHGCAVRCTSFCIFCSRLNSNAGSHWRIVNGAASHAARGMACTASLHKDCLYRSIRAASVGGLRVGTIVPLCCRTVHSSRAVHCAHRTLTLACVRPAGRVPSLTARARLRVRLCVLKRACACPQRERAGRTELWLKCTSATQLRSAPGTAVSRMSSPIAIAPSFPTSFWSANHR